MNLPTRPLPYLALLASILALSFSAIFVRWAEAPATVFAMYRMGIAAMLLTPLMVLQRSRSRRSGAGKPTQPTPEARTPLQRWAWLVFPILAGIFTAADHTTWNIALTRTNVANATLLNNTAPLWVALVAVFFFGERLGGRFWAGLGLTLAGAVAVLGTDFIRHPQLGWGDLIALGSALFYAAYFLTAEKGRQHMDTLSFVWSVALSSALVLLLVSLVLRVPVAGFSTQTYLAFLGAALISQVGGYLSMVYALGHLPASVVSPTMIAQPVLTAFLAFFLLGEKLYPAQWIGGLTVLLGIYIVHVSREHAAHANPPTVETSFIE